MTVRKYIIIFQLYLMVYPAAIFCQSNQDSLVIFSDLNFHSEFEKKAVSGFIKNHTDTFNLFMAIDENMDELKANACFNSFQTFFGFIKKKKFLTKNQKKKIRYIFNEVHESFLRKYNEVQYFPQIFIQGSYNCVSASMLYSLVFQQSGIEYKIMQTPTHVYLVANPGKESMIIETTNPDLQRETFTYNYKKESISRLESMKMITQADISKKSIDELFYEVYYKGSEAEFENLAGFEYFNKGLLKFKSNEVNEAYKLLQKAYFFFPDSETKNLLYSCLIQIIQNCKFKNISDIDYLIQLSRYNPIDQTKLINVFTEIINYYLQFTDKAGYCDSLYVHFIQQIKDSALSNEISFSYYLLMSKHFASTGRMEPYIEKAIAIKQNHIEANNLFLEQIEKRLDIVSDFDKLLDSIQYFEEKYKYSLIKQTLSDYRLVAYLNKAKDYFSYNRISDGEQFLQKFEESVVSPIELNRKRLIRSVESTYRSLALYYFYRNQKQSAQKVVDRGLKYVPGSRYIQTAVY